MVVVVVVVGYIDILFMPCVRAIGEAALLWPR